MEGKTDLAQFVVKRGKKAVEEAIRTGWEIEKSEETFRRQRMSRMEILQEALKGNCAENCDSPLVAYCTEYSSTKLHRAR